MTAVQPPPVGALRVLRQPAFWVVLALLVAGGMRIGAVAVRFGMLYPRAAIVAAALFALLAVPFWVFVRELDFLEREPVPLLILAFAWGAGPTGGAGLQGTAAAAADTTGPWRRHASTVLSTAVAIAVLWIALSALGGS